MTKPLNKSKKRLIIVFTVVFMAMSVMCFRLGWVQIVKGDEYSKLAVEQQTKDIPIEAKRGTIYDTNGTELAISAACYSIWARPDKVKDGNTEEEQQAAVDDAAKTLAEILKEDEEEIKKLLTKEQSLVKIAKYQDKDTADAIREKGIPGIEIAEDVKRNYPLGAFCSHVLGSVTDDNNGLSGIELEYNQYLKGTAGRWIKDTAADGKGLSYGVEKYYEAEDGLGLVLTIDEVIQHYAEKAIAAVQKETKADNVMCVMMDPKTGDVLAMASTPEFNPNDPKTPSTKKAQKALKDMTDEEKLDYWNSMWRNPLVSDTYEPGSTFKLLTLGASLEEGIATPSSTFNCSGTINVEGSVIKCWRYYQPHGHQTLTEATGNSCNPVFVQLALQLGKEKYYNYLDSFGVTEKTGLDYPGETDSILLPKDSLMNADLARVGFGQSINITPIQLITAVSSYGNGGKLMQPRLVKELVDEDGNTVKEIEPKVVRQVVSEKTSKQVLKIMRYAVDEGGAGTAKIEGYAIGGKTGTAQKTIDGKISEETYSSFIGMAPIDDPQVAILVVVDNPKGIKFGSQTAAPGAKEILEDTLRYLNIRPSLTKEEQQALNSKTTEVPDITGESFSEASGILAGKNLKYEVSPKGTESDFTVQDQYPKAGAKVTKGSTVYLYKE